MKRVLQRPETSRGESLRKARISHFPVSRQAAVIFAVALAIVPLTGCPTGCGPLFPFAVRRNAIAPGAPGASEQGKATKSLLNNFSSSTVLTQADSTATPEPLPAGTYQQVLVRQSDCSISRALGSAINGTINALYPNFQNDLRAVAQLTPNPLPHPYPNGCAASSLGVAASEIVIAGKLANGNYYGAQTGNTGIITYLSTQLTSYTTTNVDTSNGSSTASPAALVAADLNGDGFVDLVVANYDYASSTGNTISVLLARSDGTYGAPTQIPMLASAQHIESLTVADANGDGYPDLLLEAVGVNGAFNLVVALGKGNGTFAPLQAVIAQPVPPYNNGDTLAGGSGLAAADLNGDGHLDLIDASGFVFLGDGSGNFKLLSTTPIPASGSSLAISDFNKDGKPDLAFTNSARSTVSIFLGKGDGTFTQGNTYATIYEPFEIAAADLDGDSNVDLAVGISGAGVYGPGSYSGGLSDYQLGHGDGTFAAPRVFLNNSGSLLPQGYALPPVVADFNADGRLDLVETGVSGADDTPVLKFAAGNGDGTFAQPQQAAVVPASLNPQGEILLTADLNGDGKPDALLIGPVVAASISSGEFCAFLGKGDGTFQSPTPVQSVGASSLPFLAAVADFTGDGKPDLVVLSTVGTASTGILSLFPGKGDGTFGAAQTIDTYGPIEGYGYGVGNQLATADLNGDGKPDLIVYLASTTAGSTTYPPIANIYLNKGTGTFSSSPVPGVSESTPISGFGVGDVNGDGTPDLVLDQAGTGQFEGATLLLGKGDGTFAAGTPINLVSSAPNGPISIQDLNGDGNADLYYQGYCPGAACGAIALGNGDGTFTDILPMLLGFKTLVSTADLNGDKLPDLLLAGFYGPVAVVLNNGFGSPLDLTGSTASTTTVAAAPNPATVGQSVTFTAKVAAGSGATGTPTGTVTFLNGSASLGTGTLNSGNATFSTSSLAAGTYSIIASYPGDDTFAASESVAISLTVNAAPVTIATTTKLTSSSTTAVAGTKITFSALVSPASGSGVPTGSVAFSDGKTQLGTSTLDGTGNATFSTTSLATGTHAISASYGGNTNYDTSTSFPVSITITAPSADFSISLSPTSGTVSDGNSVTSNISITPVNGFHQQVSLSCSGTPANAACNISPTTVTPVGTTPSTATLSIQTGIRTASLARPSSTGTSSEPAAWALLSGGSLFGLALIRRRRRPGWRQFLATLALTVAMFALATGCGGAGHPTAPGTYTITVTATSGADTHTAHYSLTVQ